MAEGSHTKDNDIKGRLALITGASGNKNGDILTFEWQLTSNAGGYIIYGLLLEQWTLRTHEKLGSDERAQENWYCMIAILL